MPARPADNTPSSLMGSSGSKAVAALATYEGLTKAYDKGRQFWRERFSFSVSVSERDILYPDVHAWLLEITPDSKHRALLVSSSNSRGRVEPASDSSDEDPKKPLIVRFNDKAERTVIIDGHKVNVSINTPEVAPNASAYREPEAARIHFNCRSYEAQQAVIKQLNRINAERATTRKAVLRMVSQWGSWTTRSDLPARTMESVSLPEDQKLRISNDLSNFLESEDKYNRLAIPWHRGYMFHGPPGTGKTSIVKALANEYNLDLWYVSLADLKAESSLLGLLAEVGPRSLLLLEDIDTMKITNDNQSAEQGTISIGSLLNTLDGVATPHGLITIMTTNNFEKLDDRLTRAGRMDLIEKIDFPSINTISAMYRHFYNMSIYIADPGDVPIQGVSSSRVAEIFKRHLDSPADAAMAVQDMLIKECVIEGMVH